MSKRLFLALMGSVLLAGNTGSVWGEVEPNDNFEQATVTQVNTADTGRVSLNDPLDLYDIYKVEVPEDGFFQVGVVPVSTLQVGVSLVDGDAQSEMVSNSGDNYGKSAGFVYRNLRAGWYYIIVYAVKSSGDYNITFSFGPTEEVDAENNDSPATAGSLPLDGSSTGHLGYHGQLYSDGTDYFLLETTEDGAVELNAYPDGDLNVHLSLIDTDGITPLSEVNSYGKGQSEKIVYSNLAKGQYYVRVIWTEGWGSYTLSDIFTVNDDPNDTEPNDDSNHAIPLTLQDMVTKWSAASYGRVGYTGNRHQDTRDFYRFTMPFYGKLALNSTVGKGNNVAVGYSLFDANKRYLTGSGSNTYELDLNPGTYYLEVYLRERFGAYNLSLLVDAKTPPVDYTGEASSLAYDGGAVDASLSGSSPDLWYRVSLPADGQFTVNGQYANTYHASIYLYDANGRTQLKEISGYYDNNLHSFSIPNLLAGEYLLRAYRHSGSGVLTLSTAFAPVAELDDEPNDERYSPPNFARFTQTVTGYEIDGHIGYYGNGYTDIYDTYNFEIATDGVLTYTITGDSTFHYTGYLYCMVNEKLQYWTEIGAYYNKTPVSKRIEGLMAGRYQLFILRHSGYGSYKAAFDFIPNLNGYLEQDNVAFMAHPIEPTGGIVGHVGFSQTFETDTDDWYKVTLPEDGSFSATIQGDASMHYTLYLYQSDARTYITETGSYYNPAVVGLSRDNLRAGVYYLRVYRNSGQGTYHIFTQYTPFPYNDDDGADQPFTARPLVFDQATQGALGYTNHTTLDSTDWYVFQVAEQRTFRMRYQIESRMHSTLYLYNQNLSYITELSSYYNTNYTERDVTLNPGTYYLRPYRNSGTGFYTFYFGSASNSSAGTIKGKVVSSKNFPLFEIDVTSLDRSLRTDFSGQYQFDNMIPGTYGVRFSSGSKYYPETYPVTVEAGKVTELNVTMHEVNLTPPADASPFYGNAADQCVYLYWLPSASPDVADGGGYKLYIDDQAAIDMKGQLFYRSFGFENGRSYTFRLTAYDKYGLESGGKTVVLTPTGSSTQEPTPTPTLEPEIPTPTVQPVDSPTVQPADTPTPTPTLEPEIPTPTFPILPIDTLTPTATSTPEPEIPTPTVLPTDTPTVQPDDTPTPTVTPEPPTFTPTIIPEDPSPTPETIPTEQPQLEPAMVYEFDQSSLAENGWTAIPGGFQPATPPGVAIPQSLPQGMIPSSLDQKGLAFIVKGNEVAFVYANQAVDTMGYPCLIRAVVRADNMGGQVALVALKGQVSTATDLDGSIATHIPQTVASYTNEAKQLVLVYQPDTSNLLTPVIQVAGTGFTAPTTIYIDRLEIFRLDSGAIPVEMFSNQVIAQ